MPIILLKVIHFINLIIFYSLRRKKGNPRKYGILKQSDKGEMEMEPLGDGYDDDDDFTVFEANRLVSFSF